MIAVIIAGGSGTRLWPLSTPQYPKHLLKVNGDTRSLLQQTYDRAKLLTSKVYIVSESSHINHIKGQLPELPDGVFIVEPARRGTASCIVAALSYLSNKHDNQEPIIVLPADHYIRDTDGFIHSFKIAADTANSEKKMVLIGAEPSYPATSFGYIEKGEVLSEDSFVYRVKSFKEKPDHDTARAYLRTGNYLWNCGYFLASLEVFKELMEKHAPNLLSYYDQLQKAKPSERDEVYLGFENNTIDYALIEHVTDLLVVPASFDWMDLGSYSEMHKAVSTDELGNHVSGKNVKISEVENSFIQNYEQKPVAVIGLDNVVVINTKDGVLVARKDLSQQVGELSKTFGQTISDK